MDWKAVALLPEKEQMRAWVQNWKRIGPELEKIKRDELRALSDEEWSRRTAAVMNSRPRHARERAKANVFSGLVEQQRIFSRAYRRSSE